MICYVIFIFTIQKLLVAAADPPGGYYTTRYDHLDIENILNQKRLVHYYAACLLDKGPCTPQGIEFKNILPEAIKTNCLRCTEKQRVVTLRSIRRLRKEYPDIWKQLQASWDPTGTLVKRLEESVNKPIPLSTLSTKIIPVSTVSTKVTPLSTLPSKIVPISTMSTNRIPISTSSSNTQAPTESVNILSNRFNDETEFKREDFTSSAPVSSTIQVTQRIGTTGKTSGTKPIVSTPGTTLKMLITTLRPSTTPKFKTTTYRVTNRIVSRPFSSIGPNLVIPNPKAIIDKVFLTAGAVLNSVTNTVTNTVVTVFKG